MLRAVHLILVNRSKELCQGEAKGHDTTPGVISYYFPAGFRARAVAVRIPNLSVTFSLLVVPPMPQPALPCPSTGLPLQPRDSGLIPRDHEASLTLLWCRANEPGQGEHMTSSRRLVSSGSPLEPEIGFSRAVRSGPYVCVAGTAPIAEGGGVAARGDVYGQAVRCLDIAEQALREAGASLADVVRTRVMLTDITQWREAARAHAERFAQVRPACTFIEVSRFVDPEWLVEFELDAISP